MSLSDMRGNKTYSQVQCNSAHGKRYHLLLIPQNAAVGVHLNFPHLGQMIYMICIIYSLLHDLDLSG